MSYLTATVQALVALNFLHQRALELEVGEREYSNHLDAFFGRSQRNLEGRMDTSRPIAEVCSRRSDRFLPDPDDNPALRLALALEGLLALGAAA
jgi:hypothetical protein